MMLHMAERRLFAAVTVAHNEGRNMLPKWHAYYSAHVANRDLFVIDHESTDGSTTTLRELGVNIVPLVVHQHQPEAAKRGAVESLLSQLFDANNNSFFATYRVVIVGDADELVLADPVAYPGGLREFASMYAPHAATPSLHATPLKDQRSSLSCV